MAEGLRRCETIDGVLVDPIAALRAALVGQVRRVVMDAAGVPIEVGRRRRLFTGIVREIAKLGSPVCVHPGCDRPVSECEIDHLLEWAASGTTGARNAAPACGLHNRAKHRYGYEVQRDGGGVWHTFRPDGTEIASAPPPRSSPHAWMIEVDHRYQGRSA
ncbi:MAG: HNH endonuclease signature motif containing protein [Ilumatobacteraceae bacterium]